MPFSQAALNAGDIAFIGINTDTPDGFAIITLTDIPAGEVVNFTDTGWNRAADDAFNGRFLLIQ